VCFLLNEREELLRREGVRPSGSALLGVSQYYLAGKQGTFPGDLAMKERITAIMRWNVLAMVVRAIRPTESWADTSRATLRPPRSSSCGVNHFFRASTAEPGGDLVFYQPQLAPGIHARASLEGRLTEE
jgi:pyruvate dehydrogenase E1 component